MSPLVILKTSLSSLGASKLRSGLTVLGIVIGVAAVITLMAIGRGAEATITQRIEGLGTNLLFVGPEIGKDGPATLTLDDANALIDPLFAPGVAAVAPELIVSGRIKAGREYSRAEIRGITPDYEFVRNFEISSGQFISSNHVATNAQVAVLGSDISETIFGFRDPVGQFIRLDGRQFNVIGVLKSKGGGGKGNEDRVVLVPITTTYYRLSSQRSSEGSILVQNINVQVKDVSLMDETAEQVKFVLRLRHRITGEDDFFIFNQQDALETLEDTTNDFVVFLGAIASISLLVGGIGVMNIMLVSVTERTREIGLRKAMGAKRRDILLQFVSEATVLTVVGGLIGVLSGFAFSNILDGRSLIGTPMATAFSGDIAVLALFVSAGIGLFFGIYPAMRASRLHPIDALRHE